MAKLSMWIRSLLTRPQQTPVPLSWLNVTLPTSSPARRAAQPNSNAYGAPAACAVPDLVRPADSSSRMAEDHNSFALALYKRLMERGGNQFFSPLDIRSVLVMAYAGARGETAAQMQAVLSLSSYGEAFHVGYAEMLRRLETPGTARYRWAVANSLWAQQGSPLQAEFVDRVARHYGGELNLLDFRQAEAARAIINRWALDRTRNKIRDIIPPDCPDMMTRLILVNAVYFRAPWAVPFDRHDTIESPFWLERGNSVPVQLMHQVLTVPYQRGSDYQAVHLPYAGRELSMLLILPDRRDGLWDLERQLRPAMFQECLQIRAHRSVAILLPRFKINGETADIEKPLAGLGLRLPFTPSQADFSGIDGRGPPDDDSLFIQRVLHKAFTEVNEQGTEAASSTMAHLKYLSMPTSSPPPAAVFRADHPFLFAIIERHSGTILFLGRVANPTRQG
jgi:serpin B